MPEFYVVEGIFGGGKSSAMDSSKELFDTIIEKQRM